MNDLGYLFMCSLKIWKADIKILMNVLNIYLEFLKVKRISKDIQFMPIYYIAYSN